MSHIKITVDGKVLMDTDPGKWRSTPPDIPDLKRQSGGHGQGWGLAVMVTLAQAGTLAEQIIRCNQREQEPYQAVNRLISFGQ
ncbi:Hypothetical major facilitator transporter [Mycobacteroides abscessus subsp. bolletii]|nr:Hypothetical major facilitator transporter [Mycobacteroides abscessus subsp. bolletii]